MDKRHYERWLAGILRDIKVIKKDIKTHPIKSHRDDCRRVLNNKRDRYKQLTGKEAPF